MSELTNPAPKLPGPRSRVQELLRAKLMGEHYLDEVLRLTGVLARGQEGEGVAAVPLDSVRVAGIGKAIDTYLRLLGKVLPDLKAVELTGEGGGAVELEGPQSERMVLLTKVLALAREGGLTLEGEAERVEDDLSDLL